MFTYVFTVISTRANIRTTFVRTTYMEPFTLPSFMVSPPHHLLSADTRVESMLWAHNVSFQSH